MREKIKAIGKYILELLIGIVLSPLIILVGVGLILYIPFDYIRYKNSMYYKVEKERYSPYKGSSLNSKIYNEIAENNLPIKYVKNPQDKLQRESFVFDKTLIIINCFVFDYDLENEKWVYSVPEDEERKEIKEIMTLDEYIEIDLQEYNEYIGETPCEDAIVLISEDDVYNLEMAAKEKRFLLYKKDRVHALKEFIDSRRCEN